MRQKAANSTSQSIDIFIADSSSTTGQGLAGLLYNSSSLACYSRRGTTGAAASVTLATLSGPTAAWSSGGFVEIDATHMKGWYRFDIPDALLATTSNLPQSVHLHFYGATNMAPLPVIIQITGYDPYATAIALSDFVTFNTGKTVSDVVAGSVSKVAGDSAAVSVGISATAAARLTLSAVQIISGTVDTAGFTPTTTEFESSSVVNASANFWKGATGIFTSGALVNLRFFVNVYSLVGGRGHFTVLLQDQATVLPSPPANGVSFILV